MSRLQLGAHVRQGMFGKIAAVFPQIAPDAQNALERLTHDARRERSEG